MPLRGKCTILFSGSCFIAESTEGQPPGSTFHSAYCKWVWITIASAIPIFYRGTERFFLSYPHVIQLQVQKLSTVFTQNPLYSPLTKKMAQPPFLSRSIAILHAYLTNLFSCFMAIITLIPSMEKIIFHSPSLSKKYAKTPCIFSIQ